MADDRASEARATDRLSVEESMRADGAGFENLRDPGAELLRQLPGRHTTSSLLDQVFTVDHRVPVGNGITLAVTEKFTLRSILRLHKRAVLMLNGSAFRGNHFNMPVAGYDGGDMIARKGAFAFTVDYIGVGDSTRPDNGVEASYEANRAAVETLIRYIRFFRLVPKVDLIGEGYGGALATELSADGQRVRSVSASSMLYREVGGGPLTDPFFVSILQGSPDGYFFIPGEGAWIFMEGAPQAAKDFVALTQTGTYPTPNFLIATQLPWFDPAVARAPGLILYGQRDFISVQRDIENMVAEWGDDARLLVNPDAGHAPRTEGPANASWFWRSIFTFIGL